MTYDELLREADSNNLITKEKDLRSSKGRIKGNRIAIKRGMSSIEKACVLAEELGHHHTTTGNILDQSQTANRKQEYRARLVAYNKMIGLNGIINAYKRNCQNRYDMATYLGVSEEFLIEALEAYKAKYGTYTTLDNYMIYFEPLGVLELYK